MCDGPREERDPGLRELQALDESLSGLEYFYAVFFLSSLPGTTRDAGNEENSLHEIQKYG